MFGWLDRLSLVSGPLPVVLAVCGIAGAGWLLASRRRWFLRWALPASVVGAVAATLLLWVIVEKVWKPFPDPIETSVYVWIGIGLWAALLALPRAFTTRKWWVPITVLAAGAVVLAVAVQINLVFYAYPTVGTALGLPDPDRIDFAEVPPPTDPVVTGRPSRMRGRRRLPPIFRPAAATRPWPSPARRRGSPRATPSSICHPPTSRTRGPAAGAGDARRATRVPGGLAQRRQARDDDGRVRARTPRTRPGGRRSGRHGFAAGQPVVSRLAAGEGRQLPRSGCTDLDHDAPAGRPRSAVLGGRRIVLRRNVFAAVATNHPEVYPTFLDLSVRRNRRSATADGPSTRRSAVTRLRSSR